MSQNCENERLRIDKSNKKLIEKRLTSKGSDYKSKRETNDERVNERWNNGHA